MAARKQLIETLFIDEGFGALDSGSLDLAMEGQPQSVRCSSSRQAGLALRQLQLKVTRRFVLCPFSTALQAGRPSPSWLIRQCLEGHIQGVNETLLLIGKMYLTIQLAPERFDHTRPEAPPGWRINRRAAVFSPCQI